VDEDYIAPVLESDIYRYYGLASASPSELNEFRGRPDNDIEQGQPAFPVSGEPPAAEHQSAPRFQEEQHMLAEGEREAPKVRLRRWLPGR
jgi:hypothetical protein